MKICTARGDWTHIRRTPDGDWVEMTPEEVEKARLEGEREQKELAEKKGHVCDESPQSYEFWDDGRRYHGWECSLCGHLLHTG